MKFVIFLGLFAILAMCLVQAQPLAQEDNVVADPITSLHNRQKRATCDLLSGFSVNHSACAVHCIALGKSGGYCNDKAVCVCRR